MGETRTGWAEARRKIVVSNIQGSDIVFLQEVQWKEESTKEYIADPAGYDRVLVRSTHENRNTCILYNAKRLQREDEETGKVTTTLNAEEGWTAEYSKRLCMQVFSLNGKGDPLKFVAISVHAPNKEKCDAYTFCKLLKTAITNIVDKHKLPVLVGGDFNTNISGWKDEGFVGLDYDTECEPIDFITMKVPEKNKHLKMKKVQKKKREQIVTLEADHIKVELKNGRKMKVEALKDRAVDDFYGHLCGYHMPLTVDIVYSDVALPTEGAHDEDKKMSRELERLKEENDRLEGKVKELERKIEEMKKQHPAELSESKRKPKS